MSESGGHSRGLEIGARCEENDGSDFVSRSRLRLRRLRSNFRMESGWSKKKRSKGSADLQFSDDGQRRDFAASDLIIRAKVRSSNDHPVRTTCHVVLPGNLHFPGKSGPHTARASAVQSVSARRGSALTPDCSPAQDGPASGWRLRRKMSARVAAFRSR